MTTRYPLFVYILRCADNTYYTGIADWASAILDFHNAGKGGAYTRCRRPVQLVYADGPFHPTETAARKLKIEGFSDAERLSLIERNLRRREKLLRDIRAIGGLFGHGETGLGPDATARQLSETLSMLRWEEKVHAEEAESMRERRRPLTAKAKRRR